MLLNKGIKSITLIEIPSKGWEQSISSIVGICYAVIIKRGMCDGKKGIK